MAMAIAPLQRISVPSVALPCKLTRAARKDWQRQGSRGASFCFGYVSAVTCILTRLVSRRCASRSCKRCALRAVTGAERAEEKPERTTLYTKAGPDGVSLGDCPFSHSVQMALKLKGVDYDVVPCSSETKPQWLLDEVDGKMPCVYHARSPHVETSEILAWIDKEFSDPPLAVPENYAQVLSKAGIWPAIVQFTKNTDSAKDAELKLNLQMALTRLRNHFFATSHKFVCGPEPSLLDCDLLSKLYVLEHSTSHFKGFSLMDYPEADEVREYYLRGAALPAFKVSAYPNDIGVWGWGEARGE
eukprot:TRINITY_DN49110_c0_g1_i1.p1 TRINITY_DN49110_c0_g1~~TRINITY_DN49110_c0_g1_i1.p1  ORF type:complete len:315 (-),score=45.86 TRINITY_DN49110_c0_g1_i1:21-923(-)